MARPPTTPIPRPFSVTSSRSVRASTARADYKSPRIQTHTYIFVNDIITASYMNTSITQNSAYTTRLRAGLTDLLTLSVNFPETLTYDEQPGSVEVIWPDTGAHTHVNCGVMRFANAWTDFAKRSVRLKFRKEYGAAKLEAPLYAGHERGWPAIDKFDSLDIRSGSQDMSERGFYMAPIFVDDAMNDMGSINPHGRFVNLYLNGAYYGKFHLRERLIDQFLSDYLGGPVTDYVTVRGNDNVGTTWVPGTPEPVNRASWDRVRSLASSYHAVKPYLDVPHYIDFMLLWLYGNCENEYRSAGPVEAGTGFKFYISDPDGFLRVTTANNTGTNGPGNLLALLRSDTDPDFKMLFADRTYKHFFHDGAMTPAKMSARLTARMNQIYNAMVAECARWTSMTGRTPVNWASAEANIQNNMFPARTAQLLGYLRTAGLYPASVNPPEFNQHGGQFSPGFVPVVTAGTGTIYYTLDGSDPRLPGGAVSPAALVWIPGALILNDDTTIKTRLRNGTTWSALNEVTFTRLGRVPASAANTLVTELHYNPQGTDGGEFIELMNIGTNRVDFTNVRFTEGLAYTFPAGFSLDPGEFALVVENTALFSSWYQTPGPPWYRAGLIVAGPYTSGKLSNGGERIALLASNNTEIAAFAYGVDGLWPARADGGGSSLELRDPDAIPADQPARNTALGLPDAWRSSLLRHGSPGRIDTVEKTVVIHEVLSHTDADTDWLELHNRGTTSADLSGLYLSDNPALPLRFQIPNGTLLPAGGYLSFSAAQLGFGFSELGSDILLLEASGTNVVRYLDTVDIPEMAREETAGLHLRTDGVTDFTELLYPDPRRRQRPSAHRPARPLRDPLQARLRRRRIRRNHQHHPRPRPALRPRRARQHLEALRRDRLQLPRRRLPGGRRHPSRVRGRSRRLPHRRRHPAAGPRLRTVERQPQQRGREPAAAAARRPRARRIRPVLPRRPRHLRARRPLARPARDRRREHRAFPRAGLRQRSRPLAALRPRRHPGRPGGQPPARRQRQRPHDRPRRTAHGPQLLRRRSRRPVAADVAPHDQPALRRDVPRHHRRLRLDSTRGHLAHAGESPGHRHRHRHSAPQRDERRDGHHHRTLPPALRSRVRRIPRPRHSRPVLSDRMDRLPHPHLLAVARNRRSPPLRPPVHQRSLRRIRRPPLLPHPLAPRPAGLTPRRGQRQLAAEFPRGRGACGRGQIRPPLRIALCPGTTSACSESLRGPTRLHLCHPCRGGCSSGTPIRWCRFAQPPATGYDASAALPESSCQGCHVVFIFPRRRRGAEKRMEISTPIPKFRRIGVGTMCGSSDSFPAPLRLRGRKGENFGPPDMNFPEEPI
jgi:hypothetical protein